MSNPSEEKHRLLRQHRFEVVRESNHRVWRNPEGKILVESKTPGDWRWELNSLSVLKRIIGAAPPVSAVVEEEKQRIELDKQEKARVGMQGAGKGKKSKGTGYTYVDKLDTRTDEEKDRDRTRTYCSTYLDSRFKRKFQKLSTRNIMSVKPLMSEVGDDFEATPTTAPGKPAEAPKPPSLFSGVSAKTAARAKQGDTSNSRTGKRRWIEFFFLALKF